MTTKALQILFIDDNKEESEYFIHRIQMCSPEFTILHTDTGQAGLAMCKGGSVDCIVLKSACLTYRASRSYSNWFRVCGAQTMQ